MESSSNQQQPINQSLVEDTLLDQGYPEEVFNPNQSRRGSGASLESSRACFTVPSQGSSSSPLVFVFGQNSYGELGLGKTVAAYIY